MSNSRSQLVVNGGRIPRRRGQSADIPEQQQRTVLHQLSHLLYECSSRVRVTHTSTIPPSPSLSALLRPPLASLYYRPHSIHHPHRLSHPSPPPRPPPPPPTGPCDLLHHSPKVGTQADCTQTSRLMRRHPASVVQWMSEVSEVSEAVVHPATQGTQTATHTQRQMSGSPTLLGASDWSPRSPQPTTMEGGKTRLATGDARARGGRVKLIDWGEGGGVVISHLRTRLNYRTDTGTQVHVSNHRSSKQPGRHTPPPLTGCLPLCLP